MTRFPIRWVGVLGALGLSLVAVEPFLPSPLAPRIHVRWDDGLGSEERERLESAFRLAQPEPLEGATWRYDLVDPAPENVAALIAHRAVADTHEIDRIGGVVQPGAPRGTTWIRSRAVHFWRVPLILGALATVSAAAVFLPVAWLVLTRQRWSRRACLVTSAGLLVAGVVWSAISSLAGPTIVTLMAAAGTAALGVANRVGRLAATWARVSRSLQEPTVLFRRSVRFWSSHLLLLNVVLLALVWALYGSPTLFAYGYNYAARARDFWLTQNPAWFETRPGIENVLLPGAAAMFGAVWNAVGFELTDTTFLILAAIPYPLFIYAVARHVGRTLRGGRLLALATAVALYTSGMIPYMTSWGGYLDGLNYLLMVPVFVWPESLMVYAVAFVLQCLNHYLGAVALLLLTFVWHSMKALDQGEGGGAMKSWLASVATRMALSAAIFAAFVWFWDDVYPAASEVRRAVVLERWKVPGDVLREVLGPFPWTLFSTLKLAIVPVTALMTTALPFRSLRILVLAVPFLAAAVLTLVFFDVTRVATMMVMPALLVTIHAASGRSTVPTRIRRRLRRLLVATALLNLLIPNYYVNNGNVIVPPPEAFRAVIINVVQRFDQP